MAATAKAFWLSVKSTLIIIASLLKTVKNSFLERLTILMRLSKTLRLNRLRLNNLRLNRLKQRIRLLMRPHLMMPIQMMPSLITPLQMMKLMKSIPSPPTPKVKIKSALMFHKMLKTPQKKMTVSKVMPTTATKTMSVKPAAVLPASANIIKSKKSFHGVKFS